LYGEFNHFNFTFNKCVKKCGYTLNFCYMYLLQPGERGGPLWYFLSSNFIWKFHP